MCQLGVPDQRLPGGHAVECFCAFAVYEWCCVRFPFTMPGVPMMTNMTRLACTLAYVPLHRGMSHPNLPLHRGAVWPVHTIQCTMQHSENKSISDVVAQGYCPLEVYPNTFGKPYAWQSCARRKASCCAGEARRALRERRALLVLS